MAWTKEDEQKLQKLTQQFEQLQKYIAANKTPAEVRSQELHKYVSQTAPIAAAGNYLESGIKKITNAGADKVEKTLTTSGITADPLMGIPGMPVIPRVAKPGEQALKTAPEGAKAIAYGLKATPYIAEAMAGGAGMGGIKGIKALTVKGASELEAAAIEGAKLKIPKEAVTDPRSRKAILEFGEKLFKVTDKGAKRLAESVDPQTLLTLRTKTKQVLDSLKVANPWFRPKATVVKETIKDLSKAQKTLTDALSQAVPKVGKAIKNTAAAYTRRKILTGAGVAAGGLAAVRNTRDAFTTALRKLAGD